MALGAVGLQPVCLGFFALAPARALATPELALRRSVPRASRFLFSESFSLFHRDLRSPRTGHVSSTLRCPCLP